MQGRAAVALLAALALAAAHAADAAKLTGNSTGTGNTCDSRADPSGFLGIGCSAEEGCCPNTNTCVKRSSCAEYVKICPPPTCGKDLAFSEITCAAESTKQFKAAKNASKGGNATKSAAVQCFESSDTLCFNNGTNWAVVCKNAARASSAQLAMLLLAVLASLLLWWQA